MRRRFRTHTWRGIRCGAMLGALVPTAAALTLDARAAAVSMLGIPLAAAVGGWAMAADADRRAAVQRFGVMASATAPSRADG